MRTARDAGDLHVDVDHDRCSGMGYCHEGMPDLFVVSQNRAWLREEFDLAAADHDLLDEVAASCPWFAINVGVA